MALKLMKTQEFGPEIGSRNELQFDILYAPKRFTIQKLRLFELDCSLRSFGPLILLLSVLHIVFYNLLCINNYIRECLNFKSPTPIIKIKKKKKKTVILHNCLKGVFLTFCHTYILNKFCLMHAPKIKIWLYPALHHVPNVVIRKNWFECSWTQWLK